MTIYKTIHFQFLEHLQTSKNFGLHLTRKKNIDLRKSNSDSGSTQTPTTQLDESVTQLTLTLISIIYTKKL